LIQVIHRSAQVAPGFFALAGRETRICLAPPAWIDLDIYPNPYVGVLEGAISTPGANKK
jgi:hypothetical protein